MAERRPAFRFRLPWLPSGPTARPPRPTLGTQTSIPPPNTTAATTTTTIISPNPATPAQTSPFRPPGLAPAPPPPPAQSSLHIESEPKTTENPNTVTPQPKETQPTTENPVSLTTEILDPTTPPQSPTIRLLGIAQNQTPPTQPRTPPRTESKPSSPSRVGTQSQVNSQPASPSHMATQSQVSSKPLSPSCGALQSQPTTENPNTVTPQPKETQPTPENPVTLTTEILDPTTPPQSPTFRLLGLAQNQTPPAQPQTPPRTESKPYSPSRAGIQSRVNSQPASPTRMATQSRASSKPPSPSRGALQSQPTSQSPSPLASQPADKIPSLPSSPTIIATKVQAKEDPVLQTPQTSSPPKSNEPSLALLDPQPNPENASNTMSNSQNQNPIEKTTTQAKVSVTTEAPATTQKSDFVPRADIAPLNGKPKSIKEVEVDMPIKKQHSNGIQTEQMQPEKQEILGTMEDKLNNNSPNRKQTNKTVNSHPMDKSPVSESLQKPTTSNGLVRVPLHKEIRDDISKFVRKMATGHQNHHPMDEREKEKPISVTTIAGENRGASMHLGSDSTKREGSVHIHRGYKSNPDESAEATTDGEGSTKGRRAKESTTTENHASKAYINSNIQGINNSIVLNSSITENNPGVHLSLSHNLTDEAKLKNKTESLETRKAEFNVTPSQKLTYEPIIRRRCLRGLFMESSDSEPDNPEKPRRHGCRYNCGEKSKGNEIEVI